MKDYLLDAIINGANKSGKVSGKVVILVSGVIIIGLVSPNSTVSQDILTGWQSNESFALDIARHEQALAMAGKENQEIEFQKDIMSLTDVKLYMQSGEASLPFLRVRRSAISAWFSGAEAQLTLF